MIPAMASNKDYQEANSCLELGHGWGRSYPIDTNDRMIHVFQYAGI